MKKVLVISYYFPPSGGPGVQRVLKFVKYLPEFGWEPVVLTVKDGDFPARDESLLSEIPSSVDVHRTKIFEPYRMYRTLTGRPADAPVDVENIPSGESRRSFLENAAGFIRETFFIPDARIGWFPYAVPEALRIAREQKIDAIYTSSPPYTTAVIGMALQRKLRIPWIAGFRDPWTGFLSSPDRWLVPKALDARLERSVFRHADVIDCAWEGIVDDFRAKFPDGNHHKCHHLPNGFDPDDYPSRTRRKKNDRFTVTYTGSMYGKRNPQTFLRSVEALVHEGAVDDDKILLRFVGRFGSEVKEMLAQSPLRMSIERYDYVPHHESINQLISSDMLLLIVDESKDSRAIVPGKVFEYLGAGKPILALTDTESAVARLMRDTGAGSAVQNRDIDGIKTAFVECYRKFFYNKPCASPDDDVIRRYERKEVTRRLAELLDYLQRRR